MDRLRAFEVFVAVVARQGFARAAEALDTSPANVTRYIAELEAHLGTRLLNRHSRKLSLTDSGQALYERARSILDEVAEAEALSASSTLQPRGRLRVNAPVSFGILHLAPLWPKFLKKYPEVELEVSLIDRVVDLVEEGFDLGIRISRTGSTTHIARKLAASRNIVCAAPGYLRQHGRPKSPADLADHACIGYTFSATGDDWHLFDAHGLEHVVKVPSVMRANNGDTARAAALAGVGVIWQPSFLVGDDLRAGRLVPLLPDYRMADIDILAVYPSRRHLSAKVRVMIDFLADAFKGTPPWDRPAATGSR
ncbi:LysR family transcriptional regulator [Variovorax ginsengisoli]|uniref:LysR family transcriptional regulator n=1 Tax=Variovorax ginsengisoli TaxID=363844 RepID=A0ABT8SC52_9BURK|nr:LysR family transcriptional regulator [Variovorax ginsengisoli]MDN8617329.1 LysR family transcriptional regulator [Variovorax ginsengisoli]MDO1536499.1 LysR family transcriptional regulator [Variovorax ginsengisoli]